MPRKIAIKCLTESDLTIFEFHHRLTAGKQKAINLNADIFIDVLYPKLPALAPARGGRFPVDLFLYGPGLAGEYNLQRKILKFGSYKNWRLDGEFIHNPTSETDRFNQLEAGDFALFEFIGEVAPDACKAVFIGQNFGDDEALHSAFHGFMGNRRMAPIEENELETLIADASPTAKHPVHGFLLEALLEDASFFGEKGTKELLARRLPRTLSRGDFASARQSAEESGERGEEFTNAFLESEKIAGRIKSFVWESKLNVISPFDFSTVYGSGSVEIDAKSTAGKFKRQIHISIGELIRMATTTARYDLYRVYEMNEGTAKLRICADMQGFAKSLLDSFAELTNGVTVDSISVDPETLPFGAEISISLPEPEE
jgi:hypothetical protein